MKISIWIIGSNRVLGNTLHPSVLVSLLLDHCYAQNNAWAGHPPSWKLRGWDGEQEHLRMLPCAGRLRQDAGRPVLLSSTTAPDSWRRRRTGRAAYFFWIDEEKEKTLANRAPKIKGLQLLVEQSQSSSNPYPSMDRATKVRGAACISGTRWFLVDIVVTARFRGKQTQRKAPTQPRSPILCEWTILLHTNTHFSIIFLIFHVTFFFFSRNIRTKKKFVEKLAHREGERECSKRKKNVPLGKEILFRNEVYD